MKTSLFHFLCVISLLAFSSCASVQPYYANGNGLPSPDDANDADISYSLFLAGGISLRKSSAVLDAIEKNRPSHESGLVLLGDVLSIDDLPESVEEENVDEVNTIKKLSDKFRDFYIIPGQKEWSSENKISHKAISSLDKLLKDIKNEGRVIAPRKGCGEPEVIELDDHTVLVLTDSQWAIEAEKWKGEKMPGCELSNVLGLRQSIKGIVQDYAGKQIIIAVHHPVYANGPTAGNYPLSSHLLPVPVLGTLITGIKTLVSSDQHFGHPAYEAYRSAIISAIDGCKSCVVVSGHEQSLQYFDKGDKHYLVAGSGEEISHARKGNSAGFSFMGRGFVRIDAMKNDKLHLSLWSVDENREAKKVWEKTLDKVTPTIESTEELVNAQSLGDSVIMKASDRYTDKNFLRGNFYRESWSEEIKMPVLRIDEVHGGLKPKQLGGGNQTRSLRLENDKGEQYVLRSIDKKVTAVLPVELRGTFAENIVQDGIAASHPYGALVVPKLAKAAGVYYTNPSVVYVPYQEALGIYNADIGDGVYLFEERPGGETASFENFGNTKETFSTLDVIEMVNESHKHTIDQQAALRARLFDVWLGDWDRHDDQVRWASFKENGITVYRPIPRDRDQVFFNNDGFLDYLASRPYFNPPLRRFEEKIDYLPGLVWAGKYFDRSFLQQLNEEEFVRIAKELQSSLHDKVIDEAFRDWPREIDDNDGSRIRAFLRTRREDLPEYAREYYKHLAREVFVPATNDQDIITISAVDDDHLQVRVQRISDDKRYRFYERTLSDRETKELRLFGLEKKDSIYIDGEGDPSIKIRVIGGSGEDYLVNESDGVRVIAYDDTDGMLTKGRGITSHLNDKPLNNSYDRTDWHLNKSIHFPLPAFYTDEGFGLSYNFWSTQYGFRSDPFKSNHTVALSYFFNTSAFIGKYNGLWPHALGELDFGFDAFFTGPTFTQYYYGLGNEYVDFGEKNSYHIVKGSQVRLAPLFQKSFGFGSRVYLSPSYQFINLEDSHEEPRFVYTSQSGLTAADFGERHYAGVTAGYAFSRLDNAGFPSRGGEFNFSIGGRTSFEENSISHALLSAEGTLYIPFNVAASVVLATHLQADKIVGDYEFFHALTLGGSDKLRGYRSDRFAGDARVLHATDLRFSLFRSRGVVPISFGLYGSFDYGRVWYEDAETDQDEWHTAVGGGLYLAPLGLAAFRVGYMVGEEDKQVNIGGALRF